MRAKRSIIATVLVASLAGVIGAAPAQAGVSQCPSGHGCLWHNLSYTGSFASDATWIKLGLVYNNQATSVKSNGNVNCARFWDNTNFTGKYVYFSRPARGGIYQDPDLRNGGGYGPYRSESWNDRIGSQNWQQCQAA